MCVYCQFIVLFPPFADSFQATSCSKKQRTVYLPFDTNSQSDIWLKASLQGIIWLPDERFGFYSASLAAGQSIKPRAPHISPAAYSNSRHNNERCPTECRRQHPHPGTSYHSSTWETNHFSLLTEKPVLPYTQLHESVVSLLDANLYTTCSAIIRYPNNSNVYITD